LANDIDELWGVDVEAADVEAVDVDSRANDVLGNRVW
jgi:hypothetical protein